MSNNNNNVVKIKKPAPKKQRTRLTQVKSWACPNKVKSAAIVVDDDEDSPADKVIVVKMSSTILIQYVRTNLYSKHNQTCHTQGNKLGCT